MYHMSLCSLIKTSVPIRTFINFLCAFACLRFKSRRPTGTCFPHYSLLVYRHPGFVRARVLACVLVGGGPVLGVMSA